MKIKIYAIGHLKESYLKQGINEYLERLKPYAQVEIIEVNDESIVNNPSPKEIEMAKDKECQRVLKLLRNDEYLILCGKVIRKILELDGILKLVQNHASHIQPISGKCINEP